MSATNCIELDLACTFAPCRRLNPFHRVLLRAVETFPVGARPGFDELAQRLRLGERVFLDQAWKDIQAFCATDDDDFMQSRLSVAGEEALRAGWFIAGEQTVRRHTLYFRRDDGCAVQAERMEFAVVRAVRMPPAWSKQLTTERIAEVLAAQKPQERLQPGERLIALAADWSTAQEVRKAGLHH